MSSKHPEFIVRQELPFNGGPPLHRLASDAVTAEELFFVRSHGEIPSVDVESFRLEVGGEVRRPLSLSLDDLRRLPQAEATVTLQCAGNRRQDLARVRPIPGELPWGSEAVSTARWRGVPLRDVLSEAEVDPTSRHVELIGLDKTERHGHRFTFGGSVPLAKAASAEVLLATTMNGAPLPAMHGFPVRAVVPGYIGARSVKWLHRIIVRTDPSENYFQRVAYRLFPPEVTAENVRWEDGLMLGDQSVNVIILAPADGATLEAGPAEVRGIAITGGGHEVTRVEVSSDDGVNWKDALLAPSQGPWVWRGWSALVQVPRGSTTIVARATDSSGATQPEDAASIWNFKGYCNNSWTRVGVQGG